MRARNWTHSGSQMLGKGGVDVDLSVLTGACLLRGLLIPTMNLYCVMYLGPLKRILLPLARLPPTTHIYTFKADKCSLRIPFCLCKTNVVHGDPTALCESSCSPRCPPRKLIHRVCGSFPRATNAGLHPALWSRPTGLGIWALVLVSHRVPSPAFLAIPGINICLIP